MNPTRTQLIKDLNKLKVRRFYPMQVLRRLGAKYEDSPINYGLLLPPADEACFRFAIKRKLWKIYECYPRRVPKRSGKGHA